MSNSRLHTQAQHDTAELWEFDSMSDSTSSPDTSSSSGSGADDEISSGSYEIGRNTSKG